MKELTAVELEIVSGGTTTNPVIINKTDSTAPVSPAADPSVSGGPIIINK